jgi:glycosyltransferase involved in cell wall biosynthesis
MIVVADDCSTVETFEAVSSAQDDRLVVHRLERNLGVGGAVLAGHWIALQVGADILVAVASDDQMEPDHLPRLLDPIVDEGCGFTEATASTP